MEAQHTVEDAGAPGVATARTGGGATTRGSRLRTTLVKEVGAEAVESYRAARSTPWGAELPKPFLRDLLHCLKGQRGWRGSRFRLCARASKLHTTSSAHGCSSSSGTQCLLRCLAWSESRRWTSSLSVRLFAPNPRDRGRTVINTTRRLPWLPRCTSTWPSCAVCRRSPTWHSIFLSHRERAGSIVFPSDATAAAAVATALGSLTTLTIVRVRRNLDLHWDLFGRDEVGGRRT
jgi:hypothetical protein